jgi:DNA-binding NarL/FixJ family response regulator
LAAHPTKRSNLAETGPENGPQDGSSGPLPDREPHLRNAVPKDERTVFAGERTVVFGGMPGAKWRQLESSFAEQSGTVAIRCDGEPERVLAQCQKLVPCTLVVTQSFVESIDPDEFAAAVDFGLSVRVLVELQQEDFHTVANLLRIGCVGVVSENADPKLIRKAIQTVGAGQWWVSRTTMSQLLRSLLLCEKRKLTEREGEILHLVGEGLKNQEIAGRLFISPETVRWHLRSLYGKLGMSDREAVRLRANGMRRHPGQADHCTGTASAWKSQRPAANGA